MNHFKTASKRGEICDMTERMIIGRVGEVVALEYLTRKGLRLLDRNVHLSHCEIDLVMESEKYCHIVEVKTLTGSIWQIPTEKVDYDKKCNLIKAARSYIKIAQIKKEIVFDIVSILIKGGKITLDYLPNAFSADMI